MGFKKNVFLILCTLFVLISISCVFAINFDYFDSDGYDNPSYSDWQKENERYMTSYSKKAHEESKNRFSVDGVYEKDLVADKKHKIYHKPTCRLVYKIPYKYETNINKLNLAIQKGYKPCQECIGGEPGYRPLQS